MSTPFYARTFRLAVIGQLVCALLTSGCDDDGGKPKGSGGGDGASGDGTDAGEEPGDGDEIDGDAADGSDADGSDADGSDADAGVECSVSCDDGNDCTTDSCGSGTECLHELSPAACGAGASCHPQEGCTQGKACSKPEDCADDDGCTMNERCGAELAMCEFDPLDGDDDGHAPSVCGGGDCDDDDPDVGPGQTERCNGEDDDCDGQADDQAECAGEGRVCVEAECVCQEGLEQCGQGGCFDLQTDRRHCGECGNDCGPAGVCNAGVCECPAPAQECDGSCVDTNTSFFHCGACDNMCDVSPIEACVEGQCMACGGEGEACCGVIQTPQGPLGDGCEGALTCSGEPGSAGASCGCVSPAQKCGEACVNLSSSESHCGQCDNACGQQQVCFDDGAGGACSDCGEEGQPCCEYSGFPFCFGDGPGPGPGGGVSCNPETLRCESAS